MPLLKGNVNTSLMKEEWDDKTDYARQYFNLVDSYRVIWVSIRPNLAAGLTYWH